jgi:hypothetical protein
MTRQNQSIFRSFRNVAFLAVATTAFLIAPATRAQAKGEAVTDYDQYKLRIDGAWYYVNPSGNIHGSNDTGSIDLSKDLGFPSYSTFEGKVDWKFTRKNHIYVIIAPLDISHSTVLSRTFVFQGQTFTAGLTSNSSLNTFFTAPGYQYDIIRRKRGSFAIQFQLDLFDTKATINTAAQTTGDGVHHAAVSATGSLISPIPVAGPEFRYFLTDSPKVFVEGNLLGMYLFGYGNFISTEGKLGVTLSRHLSVVAGYGLGSHLVVNNSTNRVGLHITNKGPVVGLRASF